jgi:hypothetical protein
MNITSRASLVRCPPAKWQIRLERAMHGQISSILISCHPEPWRRILNAKHSFPARGSSRAPIPTEKEDSPIVPWGGAPIRTVEDAGPYRGLCEILPHPSVGRGACSRRSFFILFILQKTAQAFPRLRGFVIISIVFSTRAISRRAAWSARRRRPGRSR